MSLISLAFLSALWAAPPSTGRYEAPPPPAVSADAVLLQIETASREIKELLEEANGLEWQPAERQTELLNDLLAKRLSFEERFATLLQGRLSENLRDNFLTKIGQVEENEVERLLLKKEEIALRIARAKRMLNESADETGFSKLKKELWEDELKIGQVHEAIHEASLMAATKKWAEKRRKELTERMIKEIPEIRAEIKQLENQMIEIRGKNLDPELLKLQESLLYEKVHQSEVYLQGLRLQLRVARLEEKLASPPVDPEWIKNIDRSEGEFLENLKKEKEIVTKKRALYEKAYAQLKETAPLGAQQLEGDHGLGTSLKLPEGIEEKIKVSQEIISLMEGKERTLQNHWEMQSRLVQRVRNEVPVEKKDEKKDWLQKFLELINQAIQTVLKFVNSLMPASESSRP